MGLFAALASEWESNRRRKMNVNGVEEKDMIDSELIIVFGEQPRTI